MIIFHVYIALNVSPANQHTIGSDQVKTRTVNLLWIDSVGMQARGRRAVIGRIYAESIDPSDLPQVAKKKKNRQGRLEYICKNFICGENLIMIIKGPSRIRKGQRYTCDACRI